MRARNLDRGRAALGTEGRMMLMGWDLTTHVLLAVTGVFLDWIFGEPRRWHPLVGFGRLASALEAWMNLGRLRFGRGVVAWVCAVLPPVMLACWAVSAHYTVGLALHAILLYFALGLRSLRDHTRPIEQALARGEIDKARLLTARIVSRHTGASDASALAKAAVESLLENGNDAVFGTLFWFMVAGGPGALLFRLANTLDAMWGYRTPRYETFGCAAARIDDMLNWVPARLTALSYALLGETRCAWHCWHTQARNWSSPNAGPVMASGAGALGLALGGDASYDGAVESRPPLGIGRAAQAEDIGRAWYLVLRSVLLWLGLLIVVALGERTCHA
jgi:adenosylcobinamide-phosphate synthase